MKAHDRPGPDASPVILPLRAAGREYHRTLSHLPQSTPLQSAPKARFVISWWEREVHVWQLPTTFKGMLNERIESDFKRNYRKIGRIMVIGQSNITTASISDDGTLLVVATVTDLKAFRLELPTSPNAPLKIAKVDVAKTGRGASKLQISPDKHWLCWVDDGTRVNVAQIDSVESAAGDSPSYAITRAAATLKRLRRSVPKNILLGGLGAYDRNISHVTFSPDGKMLAVADLAGYIDTWVLRGPRSKLQNGKAAGEDDDAMSSASSEDSSDEEDEGGEGQGARWIRNPKASLLPKLSNGPACLSFSEQVPGGDISIDSGVGANDYFLLAITTSKQLLAFNPLRGSLSDWSRRNSQAKLPEQFRVTRDLVKGVLWRGPRVWIYGVSYLFMLDLSADLTPETVSSSTVGDKDKGDKKQGTKRKRGGPSSGAGDRIDDKDPRASQNVRVAVDGESSHTNTNTNVQWMDVDMADTDEQKGDGATSSGFDDDDDDEDDDAEDDEDSEGGELQLMRGERRAEAAEGGGRGKRSWWHTYKYRSVLGIVPLEAGPAASGQNEAPQLEVAIVERPIWDVDLPPRYFAEGEHER